MDLFDAIARRASVRSFKPAQVSEADMEKMLDAGRRAPSGKNIQPVSYVVIRSKETLKALSEPQGCIAEASAAIALAADPAASPYWLEDASAAAENMFLAIKALGYDSVWIEGTLKRIEDKAKALLGVPAGMRLIILLPIGKAAAEAAQKPKKPLSEIVHWEKW